MKYLIFAFFSLAIAANVQAQAPRRPFPQHVKYIDSAIMPTQVDTAQMARITAKLYDDWKHAYLDTMNGSMDRIIARPKKPNITASQKARATPW